MRTTTCECGAPGPVCERCRFLDGKRPIDAEVIGALRIVTPLSASDIAVLTGKLRENVSRCLTRLRRAGRIKHLGKVYEVERRTTMSYYELVSL